MSLHHLLALMSLHHLLALAHLIGLALGAGAATVKVALLLKCRSDREFVPVYLKIVKPVTRLLLSGLALLVLSGIGWLLMKYPFSPLLTAKLVLVGVAMVLGPFIDKALEPKFMKLAPASGEPATPAFVQAQQQYLVAELIATALFYAITLMGVLLK